MHFFFSLGSPPFSSSLNLFLKNNEMGKQHSRRRGNKEKANPLSRVSAGIQQGASELVVKEEQVLPVIAKVRRP
jgi:hypothetical protein